MSHFPSVTGILLTFAKQSIDKQYFLLKQLYEIGPYISSTIQLAQLTSLPKHKDSNKLLSSTYIVFNILTYVIFTHFVSTVQGRAQAF